MPQRQQSVREVDGAEAAVLVGPQVLLAAGVDALQRVEVGHRVSLVCGVEEEYPGLTVVVGVHSGLVKEAFYQARCAPHALCGGPPGQSPFV